MSKSSFAVLRAVAATSVVPALLCFVLYVLGAPALHAQSYNILFDLGGANGGDYPYDGLAIDRAGNLYGTTYDGGSSGMGMVFKLARHNDSWILTPLYSFRGGNDGAHPNTGVTIGPDGNLYGVTWTGGLGGAQCAPGGCGTVYKLSPPARLCNRVSCPWTETVLFRFSQGTPVINSPQGRVTFDAAGNIYGTAWGGGNGGCDSRGCGAVYKLTRSGGSWTLNVLYSFTGTGDGSNPYCSLTMDAAGNLYGTTFHASTFSGGYGTVFELSPSGGAWTERTLYTFQGGDDGGNPQAGVLFDSAGNLYGATTEASTNPQLGLVFELSPAGDNWNYSVISRLNGSITANLSFDQAGNLYGTTLSGGGYGWGKVFKLSKSGGVWTQTSLHDFQNQDNDGLSPESNVVFDAAGNLFGTTSSGGTHLSGTIWEITP